MNRIQEKVKDIVEVRPYKGLRDFLADAQTTLETYCFTDDTAALMAKWLNAVSEISSQKGKAMALAGYRGVGKSHFLAAFSGIVALPELRTKIGNGHVTSAAQGLLRRHYRIINVRRGSKETLVDELKEGVRATYGDDVNFASDDPAAILGAAAERTGDLPLILVIDTAIERGSRVARNDGELLARIAEFAASANALVCVALDDDIAGADGTNSGIVRTYDIDYLDQEHLYKVVNAHIFPKNSSKEPIVNDIYNYFCKFVPNFRWSAQRFSSLYPLHPGILEVAPYVRLYVHDFALLSFAAESGERILGRPANSLIAFDEVFDKAEASLRKIDDLKDAFTAYDKLNSEVVGKVPVIQRLQAKLILKALLLLSLNGQGATAEDICSSMLIFDENEPDKAVTSVRGIIEMFSAALPEDIAISKSENGTPYYSFRVSAKENINSSLQAAIAELDPTVVRSVLRGLLQERFPDLNISEAPEAKDQRWSECVAYWRGGQRRGRIYWSDNAPAIGTAESGTKPEFLDWEAVIALSGDDVEKASGENPIARVMWRADDLSNEELETLLRHHLLQNDPEILGENGEHIRAAAHTHRVASEKIVDRIFLQNAQLVIDGFDYPLTEEARSATSVSELFSSMLEPMFETRYPMHPQFPGRLGMGEVSRIVSDLFDSSRQRVDEVQQLARIFCLPLGLVRFESGVYLPESSESVEKLAYAADVLRLVDGANSANGSVSLRDVYQELRKAPYGLVREAQHLVLASLVANRKIEFVTSKGDRINARSLDLKIIWDDIVGIAKPVGSGVSTKHLVRWAQLITGDGAIKSLDDNAERERINAAFKVWLDEWERADVLGRFEKLPDSVINTGNWSQAARVRKTFGNVAIAFRALLSGSISLEEALSRSADVFLGDEEEFKAAAEATNAVESHLSTLSSHEKILAYLSGCEPTGDQKLEELRSSLVSAIESALSGGGGESRNREVGYLWEQFQKQYIDVYAARHDMVMRSHELQEKFDEIKRTDIWWEFVNLSEIPGLRVPQRRRAFELKKKLSDLDCSFDVRAALAEKPTCLCAFRLSEADDWNELPGQLWSEVSKAQLSIRERLRTLAQGADERFTAFAKASRNPDDAKAATDLLALLKGKADIPRLTNIQIDILRSVFSTDAAGSASSNSVRATAAKGEKVYQDLSDLIAEDAELMEV